MLFQSVHSSIDSERKSSPTLFRFLCVVLFFLHVKNVLTCDKVYRLTAENGTLLSQEDFTHFVRPTKCVWEIQVPNGYRIELKVTRFEIRTSCCSCTEDFVEFQDGLDSMSPSIGRYCANNKPTKVYSSHNVLRVTYFSSTRNRFANLTTVNKFKADYQKICGRFIRKSAGVIKSPPYTNFWRGSTCMFTIVVPYGWIKLSFTNFSVGQNYNFKKCRDNFVMIKEWSFVELGNAGTAIRHVPLCGGLKPFYVSSKGRELSLFYRNSRSFNSRFTARFEAVNKSIAPCGGVIMNNMGQIYSYGYPKAFPKNTECVWKIEVPPHRYVKFKYLAFYFATEAKCTNQKVEVYDGWSSTSVKIRTDCNELFQQTWLKSRSNRLLIKASTKHKEAGTFVLSYHTVEQGLCSENEFSCTSRECVQQEAICNSHHDCSDGSDEFNCPSKKQSKALHILWVLIVFIAVSAVVIWLWIAWRRGVRRSVHIRRRECQEPENDYECEVSSQNGAAPPSYSEALNHTPAASLPSYEEALLNENGRVILEQGNVVRFLARSDNCNQQLLPRCDSHRLHDTGSNNGRQSHLATV